MSLRYDEIANLIHHIHYKFQSRILKIHYTLQSGILKIFQMMVGEKQIRVAVGATRILLFMGI